MMVDDHVVLKNNCSFVVINTADEKSALEKGLEISSDSTHWNSLSETLESRSRPRL